MPFGAFDILHGCKLFYDVPPASFQRVVAMARLCSFQTGQVIFREGDECPGVYVVGNGLVRVFKTGAGGKEHVLHMIGPGNTFAEVAVIGGFDPPASAEAVAPTICVLLPADRFRAALDMDHGLCRGMMTGVCTWVRHLVNLLEDLVLRDAAGRLAQYLLDSQPGPDGSIELPGLKRHVASHLNLTSETFSRTLRRLVDAGLITEPNAGHIRLLDPDKLRQIAQKGDRHQI
jgi:CRP-like cAMP-binding protein